MPEVLKLVLETIWLFLPAVAANMAPVIAARYGWLPLLAVPLDGRHAFRGRRLLGEHKTVRGLVVGILAGAAVGVLQGALLAGAALGAGALIGDAVKSLLKRQRDIPPGQPWPPLDQIDFALGALLVGGWFIPLKPVHIVLAPVILGLGSYLVSRLGVKLSIKKSL